MTSFNRIKLGVLSVCTSDWFTVLPCLTDNFCLTGLAVYRVETVKIFKNIDFFKNHSCLLQSCLRQC